MKLGFYRTLAQVWLLLVALCSVPMGYIVGVSFRRLNKAPHVRIFTPISEVHNSSIPYPHPCEISKPQNFSKKIFVPTNPRGAERLPPGIVEPFSDFYLQGETQNTRSCNTAGKYLRTLTVGIQQREIVNKSLQDIIAPYEYVFIWDEDLGVEKFNAEEYIKLVQKHDLEISQPAIVSKKVYTWQLTKKRNNVEVHKEAIEPQWVCHSQHLPPCAGFVEIMAPVFSRKSWRCVWHMIQNDLVHGWGLDFAMWRCTKSPHENMGIVDAQWIEHMVLPSLGDQGVSIHGSKPWEGVRERCHNEWREFETRLRNAEHTQIH